MIRSIRRKTSAVILMLFLLMMPVQTKSVEMDIDQEVETEIIESNENVQESELDFGESSSQMVEEMGSLSIEHQIAEGEEEYIPVADIELEEYEMEVNVGEVITISGTILPFDASDSEIKYTSSDTSIATVSSVGGVKGISKGNVIISLSAGEVTKNVSITVKVATTGIAMNNDFLVLKEGATYQLSSKVMPVEANQVISYKSSDMSVATVSLKGLVTAKGTGSATIIVSNGDISTGVSVIVNKAVRYPTREDKTEQVLVKELEVAETIFASEQSVVSTEMLQQLYRSKEILKIIGDGYVIEIDGKDIVNYQNEFCTDILFETEAGNISFTLNDGKELCGAITLYLENTDGKYLYLYNEGKKEYEQITISNSEEIRLTTAGKYQLRKSTLKLDITIVLYGIVGGAIVLILGTAVYIIVRHKYWFW